MGEAKIDKVTKTKILVVDDEPLIRRIVGEELEEEGFEVTTANTGAEAFEYLETERFSLVLSDVKMPEMSGMELLVKIQEQIDKPPPVILVTAFSENTIQEAYNEGAQAVFAKPIDYEKLIDTVKSTLTPLEDRWRLSEQVDGSKITKKFTSLDEAHQQGEIVFGTGGFFMAEDQIYPKLDSIIDFEISDPDHHIAGQGIIRWLRAENSEEGKCGFGVEFSHLEGSSLESYINAIQGKKLKSFIPK